MKVVSSLVFIVCLLIMSAPAYSLSCEEELSALSKIASEIESLDEGSPGHDRNCALLNEKLQSNSSCDLSLSLSEDEIQSLKNAIEDCTPVPPPPVQ